ncbi:hypothetical protein ACE1SV_73280 [Streptomyces sp. E-15]
MHVMSLERMTNRRYFVDFGQLTLEEEYESDERMTFRVIKGGGLVPDGYVETVTLTTAEIRPELLLVSWKEKSGAVIVEVWDFERWEIHGRFTLPDGTPLAVTGTMKQLD